MPGLFHNIVNMRRNKGPCTHILRFFLTPDHIRIWIGFKLFSDQIRRKRIKLFHAEQDDILDIPVAALLKKVIINLSRTKHDAPDFIRRRQFFPVMIPQGTAKNTFSRKIGKRRNT